jgi:hypothetical protein
VEKKRRIAEIRDSLRLGPDEEVLPFSARTGKGRMPCGGHRKAVERGGDRAFFHTGQAE